MKANKSSSPKSYLERLKFDPRLWVGPVAGYLMNLRVVVLLLISILFLGVISYLDLPRRLNPEIKIPIVTVITVLPGASPQDVESLVTIPIETALRGLTGLDQIVSVSRDNVSAISLQFVSGVSPDKAKTDVQSAVDSVTGLPKDALSSQVKKLDFEDTPVWTFSVRGKDTASLMRFAQNLKRKIEDVPKVDRVVANGFEDQEIAVVISPEKARDFGVNPVLVAGAIKSGLLSYPAGTVESQQNSYSLTVDPLVTSVADLRRLRMSFGTVSLNLGDVATISERPKINQATSFYADAETEATQVVTFSVYKVTNANIDAAVHDTRVVVDAEMDRYAGSFTLVSVTDTAEEIGKQFSDLLGEFRSTILLVLLCLFLFLGLRQALISSLTVPLTYLSAFIFMKFLGMSINFLSLFAFLLALGLLVDDTIVVVQAMTTYYKSRKFSPQETGLLVWKDLIVPIWSTTITTIWSFVPLLLTTGIIGEFIKPIPVVVTVTMISSTAIAVLITLPFMIVLLKPNIPQRVKTFALVVVSLLSPLFVLSVFRTNQLVLLITLVYLMTFLVFLRVRRQVFAQFSYFLRSHRQTSLILQKMRHYADHGVISTEGLSQAYYRLITRVISSKNNRLKVVLAIVVYAVVAFMLLPLGFVKNEFFPKTDAQIIYVSYELPNGTTLDETQENALPILDKLRQIPETDFVVAEVGMALGSMGNVSDSQSNAVFTIHLPEKNQRSLSSVTIAESIRNDFKNYYPGKISVTEESGGPPAGADLQIKLLGDDLSQLNTYADKMIEHLSQDNGITNINKSVNAGTSKLTFVPDQNRLSEFGISVDSVGLWLRTFASGFTLASANFDKEAHEKKDIVFQFDGGKQTPESISRVEIPTMSGSVPLLALGDLVTETNPTTINREEGKRTISVTAAVRSGFSVSEKSKELEDFANELKLEEGYSWKTGGVNEENAKSVQSILQAMIIAFILILVTMVIQFRSYRQAVIVLLVIPLAVSSVFVAFAITGTPLSFPALIGVLSLFGIVVTNSMFIVDKININLRQKMPFKEAIADAGASRLEPIILTKLCTVLGLLPITLSNALWQGLGGAIISGILIASTIMLLFIPAVYASWFGPKEVVA